MTGPEPPWLLTGSRGLWAALCLVPGCLWTSTASTPDAVDTAATDHTTTCHPDALDHPDDPARSSDKEDTTR